VPRKPLGQIPRHILLGRAVKVEQHCLLRAFWFGSVKIRHEHFWHKYGRTASEKGGILLPPRFTMQHQCQQISTPRTRAFAPQSSSPPDLMLRKLTVPPTSLLRRDALFADFGTSGGLSRKRQRPFEVRSLVAASRRCPSDQIVEGAGVRALPKKAAGLSHARSYAGRAFWTTGPQTFSVDTACVSTLPRRPVP
jgi:hypothetical protein